MSNEYIMELLGCLLKCDLVLCYSFDFRTGSFTFETGTGYFYQSVVTKRFFTYRDGVSFFI